MVAVKPPRGDVKAEVKAVVAPPPPSAADDVPKQPPVNVGSAVSASAGTTTTITKDGETRVIKKRVRLACQEARSARRREQNRINAANCKKRKFQRIQILGGELSTLKTESSTLKEELASLQEELTAVYKKARR